MTTLITRNFSAGEISPSLYSRCDLTKYQTGLRTCRNFMVKRSGGVQNRPGTSFIGEAKDSSKSVRLIPFIFNTLQTYVLEFGDQYIRFIKDGVYITDSTKIITSITKASQALVTATAHGFSNGDEVEISGVAGMTEVNGRNFKVSDVATNTFKLKLMDGTTYLDSSGFGSAGTGGQADRVYTIASTYLEADLFALKYVQSADVMTIVHPTYLPRELSRSSDTSWSLSNISFAASISPPGGMAVSFSGSGAFSPAYCVTSIAANTYEESIASSIVTATSSPAPTASAPNNIQWTNVGATVVEYNVYKRPNASTAFGFIGIASSGSSPGFNDTGIEPDFSITPPLARNPFGSSNNYPSTVTYFQQRLMFANTNNDPETAFGSQTGLFHNFQTSIPIQDDDAITFNLVGRQVNGVHHLIDIGRLAVMTQVGEWVIEGDQSGILTPSQINPRQHSYNGSLKNLSPIVIDSSALYVQARGTIVRDFNFDFQIDGYRGNDLTIFSSHLFDSYSLLDWTYQKIPHSTIWAVRDDGTLLGLTRIVEQQILGWHRHDFENGLVESVCSVPEGNEDTLYLVINRTIDGSTKRYIEKFNTRQIDDIVDSIFMDSALSYDGRNSDFEINAGHGIQFTGGTTWAYTETFDCEGTGGGEPFTPSSVGKEVHVTGVDENGDPLIIRFTIETFNSTSSVSGRPNRTVPAPMQDTEFLEFSIAVSEVGGLWHLEGEDVSVFGDGFVVANPHNEAYNVITITNGIATLDKAYAVIHVGIPITADIETLDIDSPQGETLSDKKKMVNRVSMYLEKSRGVFIGPKPPLDEESDFLGGLVELKIRSEETMDEPVALTTDVVSVLLRSEWNGNGRIFIRQTDPIPLEINGIMPDGLFPIRSGG